MSYTINFSEQALNDISRLEHNEPKAYQKFISFLKELEEHPKTGTGHPEPLKGFSENRWSREYPRSTAWCIAYMRKRS